MGYFTSTFSGAEMAQIVNAQVLFARRLGPEFESPWIKTKYFSFIQRSWDYVILSQHIASSVSVWFRQMYA